MMATEPASGVVLISEGAYRLLLRLYPRKFRDEWGLHMSRTFRDHSRERYRRDGVLGLFGLWLFTTMDVCKTALEERAHTGETFMSKDTVIRIGGPAMMVGGLLWIVANLGHLPDRDLYGLYRLGGFNPDTVWGIVFPPLFIGLYALTVYAGQSRLMRAGAWLALVASVIAYLAVLAVTVARIAWPQALLVLWMAPLLLFIPLGVSLFGIGALREKPLPRWNGVAVMPLVLLAMFVVFAVLWVVGPPPAARSPYFVNYAMTLGLGLYGLCWVLLGFAMLPARTHVAASVQA